MNNSGKLSIPAAIVISSIVIGGFYFAVEFNKQSAADREMQMRSYCAEKAGESAVEDYKEFCQNTPDFCPKDYEDKYMPDKYRDYFESCLQSQGLK